MSHQVFVPVTDDIIYNHPDQIEGPLIPYSAGMECQNWLSIEINPEEGDAEEALAAAGAMVKQTSGKRRPALKLAYSAA